MLMESVVCSQKPDLKDGRMSRDGKAVQIVFGFLIFFATVATLPVLIILGVPQTAQGNGLFIVSIGLIVLFCTCGRNLKFGRTFTHYLPFAMMGFISSVVMAVVLSDTVGPLHGETPIVSVKSGLIWIVFNSCIVLFSSYCYARCNRSFLDFVLDLLVVFVLLVGGIQAGASLGIPGFSSLFEISNVGGWFSAFLSYGPERLSVVASEPAAMSKNLGLMCLPYCYSRAINGGGVRYGVAFVALLVLAYMTRSTTVYVTVAFVLLGIAALQVHRRKGRSFYLVLSLVGVVISVAAIWLLVSGGSSVTSDVAETFDAVLGKITSITNQSTAYRNSTIINDIAIFKDYPIFGVGEGNQGYFYAKNIPLWILESGSTEVFNALAGCIGVLNGGPFIASILSGFGMVGCVLFGSWLVAGFQMAFANKERMGHYFPMYIIAMFACIPIAWMDESFAGAPVALFLVFCMPALGEEQ